jgi:hypothetical protein
MDLAQGVTAIPLSAKRQLQLQVAMCGFLWYDAAMVCEFLASE